MRYVLLLLLTSLLWAANFIISKSLIGHASSMTLTSLRWIIAVLVLIPIVQYKEKSLIPPKKALIPLFFMGVTGVVLFNIFQFLAIASTSATNASLISTLNMFSIAIFSYLFLKERMNLLQFASMLLSLTGVVFVLTKGSLSLLFTMEVNKGDIWMLSAVAVWGIYSVCSKWAMKHTTPLMATLYSGLFGLAALLPFNLSSFAIKNPDPAFVLSLLYTGIISTVLCLVLWNIGVKNLGATKSGLFLNFNPVFTAILAFLLLGEQMLLIQAAGSALVILGCCLFSIFQGNPPIKYRRRPALAAEQ